ncbi:unnamed protein product [Rotaria socialis]|nr:unnamed protein product [Rotaria socialis]
MSNFLAGTIAIKTTDLKDLPFTIQVWSYLMVFLPMLCIPGYAIYKLIITPGKTFDERLQRAVTPEEPILELIQYRLDAAQKQQQKQQQQQQKDKIELL